MNSQGMSIRLPVDSGLYPRFEEKQIGGTPPSRASVQIPDRDLVMNAGELSFLLSFSELHLNQPLYMIQRRFIHPMSIGQARLFYRKGNVPIGFVSWAWLSDGIDQAMLQDSDALRPGDWKSGNNLWFIEFVAPFGGVREMVRYLDREVFGSTERGAPYAKSYKVDPKGMGARLRYLFPRRRHADRVRTSA